jgi:hypothetical protein
MVICYVDCIEVYLIYIPRYIPIIIRHDEGALIRVQLVSSPLHRGDARGLMDF